MSNMEDYKKLSLRGKVFHRLRDDILSGKYKKNDELREITIGEELGVSRTPVREALRQLELEGLVEIVPNKGAYVTGISHKDVLDIYLIRSRLEGLAARLAAEKRSDEDIEAMEETVVLAEFKLKKMKNDQVVELDSKFHETLYKASGSRILEHTLTDYHRYVQSARTISVNTKERAEKSVGEHRAILEAIQNHDADLAEQLANEHIFQVVENLKKQNY
jgi:DNA-binding GntR family transcriptional regulator